MKKLKLVMAAALVCCLVCGAAWGCGKKPSEPQPPLPEPPKDTEPWKDFDNVEQQGEAKLSFFSSPKQITELDAIEFSFGGLQSYSDLEKFSRVSTLAALQGLAARQGSTRNIYLNVLAQGGHEPGFCNTWLEQLKTQDKVKVNRLEEGRHAFTSVIGSYEQFVAKKEGKAGYVLYKQELSDSLTPEGTPTLAGSQSVNAAFTVCAATGFLPIDERLRAEFDALGFVMAADARGMTEMDAYRAYKDGLSDKIISQTPNNCCENRDFGIFERALFIDEAYKSTAFQAEIKEKFPAGNNATVMGWGSFNEVQQIKMHAQNGFGFLCTVYNYNMSVFSSFGKKVFLPRTKDETIVADPSKHYVSFIMSDGDNLSWHHNSFAVNKAYLGYSLDKKERAANPFKMGWTIAPSMIDLLPAVLRFEYQKASPYDYFVAGTSGAFTAYPSAFGAKNAATLKYSAEATNEYLRRCGIRYTEILNDNPIGGTAAMPFDDAVLSEYAKQDNIDGAFVLANYNKYIQGGDLRWYEGKPFLGIGEAYWDDTPGRVAHRISSLKPSISTVDGYTAIKIHCWSTTMSDVAKMVSRLGEHIEIVSPGELMKLIEANVPKQNAKRTAVADQAYPDDVDEYLDARALFEQTPLNEGHFASFDTYLDYEGWNRYIGNKEYDYVSFSGEPWKHNPLGGGKQSYGGDDGYCIRFDGSDYGVQDELANAAVYSKFYILDAARANFSFMIKSAVEPHLATYRVRVVRKSGGEYFIDKLYTRKEMANRSWTVCNWNWTKITYDLSAYKGQEIVVVLEYNPYGYDCYVDNLEITF